MKSDSQDTVASPTVTTMLPFLGSVTRPVLQTTLINRKGGIGVGSHWLNSIITPNLII